MVEDDLVLADSYHYALQLQREVRGAEARLLGRARTRWELEPGPFGGSPVVMPDVPSRNERRIALLRKLDRLIWLRRQRAAFLAVLAARRVERLMPLPWAASTPEHIAVNARVHTVADERAHALLTAAPPAAPVLAGVQA